MSRNNRTNTSGKILEEHISNGFRSWGLGIIEYRDWIKNIIRPALVKNFPYKSI